MTVSKAYAELKEAGVIEARAGSGTFVAHSSLTRIEARGAVAMLEARIDALVEGALVAGLSVSDLLALLTARAVHRLAQGSRPAFVMVGLFAAATESYAARIAAQVGDGATVTPLVLGSEPDDGEAAILRSADLVITFGTLQGRIAAIAPEARIVGVRFIPAEATRLALAAIDPMARLAVVSRFADFLPVLELGVRRFAPHVASVVALDMEAPDLRQTIMASDVVVMSTGAEAAGGMAAPGALRIEYRHIPDPGDVDRLIMPWLRTSVPGTAANDADDEGHRKEAS